VALELELGLIVASKDNHLSKLIDTEDTEATVPPLVLVLEPLAVVFADVCEVPFIRTEPCTTLLALQEIEELLNTVAEPSKNLMRIESQAMELVAVTVELPSCKSAVEYFALLYFH
jgi:hypothetical protein